MVRLALGGDCLGYRWWHGGTPFRWIQPLLDSADVRAANMEAVITDRRPTAKKYVRLTAPPRAPQFLQTAGFQAMQVENNHAMDCGQGGYMDTLAVLRATGIAPLGSGLAPYRRRVGSETVCLFGRHIYPESTWPMHNLRCMVREAAASGDVPVVSLHWGDEHMPVPAPWQVAFGRSLIDAGAAVVFGHHPHVVQGIEAYHDGLIAYSLGNLNFWQLDCKPRWYNRLGGVLQVTIERGTVRDWELVPVHIGADYAPRPLLKHFNTVNLLFSKLDGMVGRMTEAEWYDPFGWGYVGQTLHSSWKAVGRHGFAPLGRLWAWLGREHSQRAIRAALRTGPVDRWAGFSSPFLGELE